VVVGCRFGFDPIDRGAGGDGGGDDGAPLGGDGAAPIAGLIASWGFDEGSGQIVNASVGVDGYLGTGPAVETVDPQWETAPSRVCSGAGLTFDGIDDIVTIPGPSTANLSAWSVGFSMVATGAGGGSLPRIVTKEDGAAVDFMIHFRAIDNAVAINMLNSAGTVLTTYGGAVVLGTRANWVLTYDDAGDRLVHIYQNGAEVTYLRQDTMTGTLRMTTNSWEIGDQATTSRAFAGTLDAVRIYERVLTPSEIIALSAQCPP